MSSRAEKTKAAYLAALRRLEKGKPAHPRLVGSTPPINVSTVCLDAGLSRNPLYAQHREVLEEIREAATRQREQRRDATKRAAISVRLKRRTALDRRAAEFALQLMKARSENLTLLYRLQEAEQRLDRLTAENTSEVRGRLTST
jgi:hypothetical protein